MSGYQELVRRFESLPADLQTHVDQVSIFKGTKKLYLIKDGYPGLPFVLQIHHTTRSKTPSATTAAIVRQMNDDAFFRHFMCVNYQEFFDHFTHHQSNFSQYYDANRGRSVKGLYIVRKFGFLEKHPRDQSYAIDDSTRAAYYHDLYKKYDDFLRKYEGGATAEFTKRIKEPLKKLLTLIGIEDLSGALDEGDHHIILKDVAQVDIQNTLVAIQLHIYFEEYVNFKLAQLPNAPVIYGNPIVLINPWKGRDKARSMDVVEGYVELDGYVLVGDEKITFLECKNCGTIDLDYVTHFLGKTKLIEHVYEINVTKLLFSTGIRRPIWKKIEELVGADATFDIFDIEDFKLNFTSITRRLR